MNIKKRRNECNTLAEVVSANVGMDIDDFLNPTKSYYIEKLNDAVDIIKNFISEKKPITVVGDYDADGIDASSILKLALTSLGANLTIRLPKRFSEGYGLSEKIVDEIKEGLLITVDNGIAAFDAIEKAKAKGLTVIVTDHHLAPEDGRIPNADIVIDPNALENTATFKGYCGAGIAYKIAVALLGENHKLIPKLTSFAAIATIADVMQLTEENRLIVQKGLSSMITYSGRTTGLGALLELCGMDRYICAKDIAFKIGPIINAAGRLDDNGAATSLETISFNSSLAKAKELADNLYQINEKRKELKEKGIEQVRQRIIDDCLFGENPLIIYEKGLHKGLVGIFAGKMAEEFKVPCFVLTDSEEPGILTGSGRSFGGVNIKELLDENADLLYKYGGHAEAAGISVKEENFDKFKNSMIDSAPEIEFDDTTYYDLEISANDIDKIIEELPKYAPFGEGNPEIVFLIKGFMLSPGANSKCYRTMGANNQHVKLLGSNASAIGFDMTEKYKSMGEPRVLDLVGTLSKNYFMGKFTNQIELIDIANASSSIPKTDMAMKLAKMAKTRHV